LCYCWCPVLVAAILVAAVDVLATVVTVAVVVDGFDDVIVVTVVAVNCY
jgi:hypothetical protein